MRRLRSGELLVDHFPEGYTQPMPPSLSRSDAVCARTGRNSAHMFNPPYRLPATTLRPLSSAKPESLSSTRARPSSCQLDTVLFGVEYMANIAIGACAIFGTTSGVAGSRMIVLQRLAATFEKRQIRELRARLWLLVDTCDVGVIIQLDNYIMMSATGARVIDHSSMYCPCLHHARGRLQTVVYNHA